MLTFKELGLRQEILSAIAALGYEQPMPVQAEVIPFMLNNATDLVALAQTGTGKTAAFGLPILEMIDASRVEVQALILSPTRELCIQIANDLKGYATNLKNVKVVPVYGGESIVTQYRQLDVAPQILVATPGRLIDLISRKKVNLAQVRYLVLDEADEMLNMGFQEDLETILQELPSERRTLLFSATMPKEIARISKKYMQDAAEITVGVRNTGSENVRHCFYMVQAKQRYLALKRIVDINPDIYGIIFCRTRQETKEVADKLMQDGYNADALHGDLSQAQRDTVMSKFRIKNLQLLVATDVAARGLDVSNLTHVINYNLPDDPEVYIHRSGRTGRANKSGVSIAIIHSRERGRIRDLERIIKKEFQQESIPNGLEICKRQLFAQIDRIENVSVNTSEIEQFMPHILKKLDYLTKEELISHFVSLEFNRFLDYYKDAPDLNLPERSGREDRSERSERGGNRREGTREPRNSGKRGSRVRFKLNVGVRQNANTRSVLSIINDTTNDKSISIGDIEITPKFTFFDVYADQADQVKLAFQNNGKGFVLSEIEGNESSERRAFRSDKPHQKRRGAGRTESTDKERKTRRYDNNSSERAPRKHNSPDASQSDRPWRRRRG